MKLVLHNYWRSSASHRVRIGLGLKQLAYEYVVVDIAHGGQFVDAYLGKNPMSQVPTLEITEDDGTWVKMTQSLPILEYLEERWPQHSILPRAPYARARVRMFAEIVNSGIQPMQNLSTLAQVKALGGVAEDWTRHFIARGLDAFAKMLAEEPTSPFCVGEFPTIADCCLIPQLAAARRFRVELEGARAPLVAIEQRCLALPAFAAAAPESQSDAVRA